MTSRAPFVLALLAASACSRDLDLPGRDTLSFVDAFPAARPTRRSPSR